MVKFEDLFKDSTSEYTNANRYQIVSEAIDIVDMIRSHSFVLSVHKVSVDDVTCNYMYLYSIFEKDRLKPIIFAYSGAFISCDGEYRPSIVYADKLQQIFEEYPDIIAEYDNFYKQLMKTKRISLSRKIYTSDRLTNKRKIAQMVDNLGLERYALIANMIIVANRRQYKFAEGHMEPSFIMIFHHNLFIDKYTEITDKFPNHPELVRKCISLREHRGKYFRLGQKFIQLTNEELLSVENDQYKAWRELAFNKRAATLTINNICHAFPLSCEWAMVYKADRYLFDNPKILNRFNMSDAAKSIDSMLEREYKRVIESEYVANEAFYEFAKAAKDLMEIGEKTIEYSNKCLIIFCEDLGETVGSISQYYRNNPSLLLMFESPENYFDKVLFEYLYAILALNRVDLVHGDLHINNITIQVPYDLFSANKPFNDTKSGVIKGGDAFNDSTDDNNHNVYDEVIGGSSQNMKYRLPKPLLNGYVAFEHKFMFVDNGFYARVIDFSRSFSREPKLMKRVVKRWAFDFYKLNKQAFTKYQSKDLSSYIKTLSILDVVALTESLIGIQERVKYHRDVLKKMKAIHSDAKQLFERSILKMRAWDSWPNIRWLTEYFIDHIVNESTLQLDAYVYNNLCVLENPLQYSMESVDNYPPQILSLIRNNSARMTESQYHTMIKEDVIVGDGED